MKKWISTTQDCLWSDKNVSSSDGCELIVTNNEQQTVRGFGGCFNELGKIALNKLSDDKKDKLMDELFLENGCNFNFCRFPVGANDYSEIWYSYNENDGDFNMDKFSIERDYVYLIPYIKEALKRKSDMEFFASPWSPPTWMKFPKAYNYGTLVWEEKYLKAYALYFAKFIEAYEKEGIHINQLHVQNEPCSTQKFPSCVWTGEQFREFIEKYLSVEFEEKNIDTDIWLGTINGPEIDNRSLYTRYNNYANVVLESEKCRKVVKGIGYQWAGKYAIQVTHNAFPDLELIQTESECGNGDNSWEYARYIFEMIHHYFSNGASAYVYWNMILEPGGESTWGWTQNSMITIENGDIKYNPEFYIMKHFAHFVKKGAKRLELKGRWNANSLAFRNPDGEIVVIIMNPFNETKTIKINDEGFELKPLSFNTIVF